jgi:DNA-binding transcriptional ArsR family regulator
MSTTHPSSTPPAQVFAALADPTRLAILTMLREGPCTVGQIVNAHDLAGATITRHLDALERAGLIRRQKRGQERHCTLDPAGFLQVSHWVHPFELFWSASLDNLDRLVSTPPTQQE